MVDMNNFEYWALDCKGYEELRGVDDTSYFGSWA